jgi:hypothetical protein
MKSSTSFVLIISLFSAGTIIPMDPPAKKQSRKRNPVVRTVRAAANWIQATGEIILHGTTPGTHLQQVLTIPNDPVPFGKLPQDVQRQIIFYLATYGSAQSLIEACQTINALAQTNKLLNELINTPSFCLHTIKQLSKRFNCDNMTVCTTLQTKQARNQALMQKELYDLCRTSNFSDDTRGMRLVVLKNKGVDLDFTYEAEQSTMLIIACYIRPTFAEMLLDAGADVMVTNMDGESPLAAVTETGNDALIKRFKEAIAENSDQKK